MVKSYLTTVLSLISAIGTFYQSITKEFSVDALPTTLKFCSFTS